MKVIDLKFGDYIYFDSVEPFIYIGNGNCQKSWKSICVSFSEIEKSRITKIQRYVPYKVHEIRRTEKGTNYTINGGDKGVDNVFRLETIYERKEILDDKEKEWLGNFIRSTKMKVLSVYKINVGGEEERICINYRNGASRCHLLPPFEKGIMYKGMELNKEYSLEELGL